MLRSRRGPQSDTGRDKGDLLPSKSNEKQRSASRLFEYAPLRWSHIVIVLVAIFLLKVAMRYETYRVPSVPDPVSSFGVAPDAVSKAVLDTDHFVVARARRTLNELTDFGVRLAGTSASEEMAVPWLLRELESLHKQLKSDSPYKLTFSFDHVSGFFDLGFLSGFTSVYANVSNVLARLDPINGDTKNALLINAHYDTHFETVGASDDAANCAIMLEILRALLSSPTPLRHSVIFLFNGAEENILQASDGFVAGSSVAGGSVEGAGHPWAKDVRAFVNMEAAGSGGRECLFQTGPGPATPILLRAYASSAVYPFANVIAQEMFQTGAMPSDTDFRIFRDHGRIPGIDFAFYVNGFVYHTKYDTPDRIPDGTLQRAGTNILAVVRTLASSDLSTMPPVDDPDDRSGEKLIYFDLFSAVLIVYPFKTVGLGLNALAVVLTIWRVINLIRRDHREGVFYPGVLLAAVIAHCLALLVSTVVVFVVAKFMSSQPICMSWYGKPWLIFPIYVFPAMVAALLVHSFFFKKIIAPRCSTANFAQKCETAYDVSFDAALVICSILLVVMSAYSIASSYVICLWVLFPLLFDFILDKVVPLGTGAKNSGFALLIRHTVSTLLPTVYTLYISDGFMEVFIPVTGRVGIAVNPEFVIAGLTLFSVVILFLFHLSLAYLCGGHVWPVVRLVGLLSGVTIFAVILTPFGHPYSLNVDEMTGVHIQRSAIQLTMQRIISKPNMANETLIRSGYWFVPLDYNGIRPLLGLSKKLDSYMSKVRLACTSTEDPLEKPYCGLPYIFPLKDFFHDQTYWIDMKPSAETLRNAYWPSINQMPTSPFHVQKGRWLAQYRLDCGDTPQCSVYISPKEGVELTYWFFANEAIPIREFPPGKLVKIPAATDLDPRPVWFVLLRFGSSSTATRLQQRSIVLTMEFKTEIEKDFFDIAIVSQYCRGTSSNKAFREIPNELQEFVSAMPHWAATIPVTSLYSSYTF